MCGKVPSEGPGRSGTFIPQQNKGVCRNCDKATWVHDNSGTHFKWCMGCKRFVNLVAFSEKLDASKCNGCRERGRIAYLQCKENLTGEGGQTVPYTRNWPYSLQRKPGEAIESPYAYSLGGTNSAAQPPTYYGYNGPNYGAPTYPAVVSALGFAEHGQFPAKGKSGLAETARLGPLSQHQAEASPTPAEPGYLEIEGGRTPRSSGSSKPIELVDSEGTVIREFSSGTKAAQEFGLTGIQVLLESDYYY